MMRPVQRGDSGFGVVEVQTVLMRQGFLRPLNSAETGHFGPLTESAVIHFQQTRVGPLKSPLRVTGRVDAATRWALEHASGEDQRLHIDARLPAGLTPKRQRLLEVALKLHALNIREQPNGSNSGPYIDDCFPPYLLNKPLPREPWCCFWAHHLCHLAHGEYPLGVRLGSCYRAYVLAKSKGVLRMADPTPGDMGVMLHRGEDGRLNMRGHMVIVLRVGDGGSRINTLEGNCGNRFALNVRRIDTFAGFINFYGEDEQPLDYERGVFKVGSAKASTR